jgi:RNA polymerase sigma-70 factor (ECF subfamily)
MAVSPFAAAVDKVKGDAADLEHARADQRADRARDHRALDAGGTSLVRTARSLRRQSGVDLRRVGGSAVWARAMSRSRHLEIPRGIYRECGHYAKSPANTGWCAFDGCAEIVARVGGRTMLAAADLVSYIPYLRRYGQRMTGNPELADDLVQETMEKALRALPDYRPIGNLQGWLIAIMRNEFRTRYRAEQRRVAWGQRVAPRDPQAPDQFDACLLNEVVKAIARMPKAQRSVLNAVCIEGCTYGQASVRLAIPIGTVRSRMARARATLAVMAGEAGGEVLP